MPRVTATGKTKRAKLTSQRALNPMAQEVCSFVARVAEEKRVDGRVALPVDGGQHQPIPERAKAVARGRDEKASFRFWFDSCRGSKEDAGVRQSAKGE